MSNENKDPRAIGQLERFPSEVIDRMLYEQVKQGNKENVSVFQDYIGAEKKHGGFMWHRSSAGGHFWYDVIILYNFDLFFEKYPKKNPKATNNRPDKTDPKYYFANGDFDHLRYKNDMEKYIDQIQPIETKDPKEVQKGIDEFVDFLGELILKAQKIQKKYKNL